MMKDEPMTRLAKATVTHSDQWGDVIVRPDDNCVEIRWFDTTATMDGPDFNKFLDSYATSFEQGGQACGLVDAVQFKMDMSKMEMGWRDANIIPRYNAAGMRKFAFVMPAGMPAIGAPPEPEGPADFPTAYFATRREALAWLNEA